MELNNARWAAHNLLWQLPLQEKVIENLQLGGN